MGKTIIKFVKEHGLLSGLITNVCTLLLTLFFSSLSQSQTIATNYISIDSFDALIDKHFISTGLVSENILQLEDLDKQFNEIATNFDSYKSELATVNVTLEEILVSQNVEPDKASSMSSMEKVLEIGNTIEQLSTKVDTIDSLNKEIESLKGENSSLSNRTTAEMKATTLVIDGEQIDTNIPSSLAVIAGHNFYSESLLNSFLDKGITYNSKESTICYGVEKPEKIVFSNQLVTDIEGFTQYTVGSGKSFKMGTDSYDNGLVKHYSNSSFFYANLKREFSEMSFKVGHIDGTELQSATISIYTKFGNEKYRLQETIDLTHDMISDEKKVTLNYADGLQLVIDGPYYADYGLADIYLYR